MQRTKPKSREEQELIINEYLSSGMEVKAWSREKKIAYSTFYTWKRNYDSRNKNKKKFIGLQQTCSDKSSIISETVDETINKSDQIPEIVIKPSEIHMEDQIKEDNISMTLEVNECKLTIKSLTDIDLLTKVIKAVKLASV